MAIPNCACNQDIAKHQQKHDKTETTKNTPETSETTPETLKMSTTGQHRTITDKEATNKKSTKQPSICSLRSEHVADCTLGPWVLGPDNKLDKVAAQPARLNHHTQKNIAQKEKILLHHRDLLSLPMFLSMSTSAESSDWLSKIFGQPKNIITLYPQKGKANIGHDSTDYKACLHNRNCAKLFLPVNPQR